MMNKFIKNPMEFEFKITKSNEEAVAVSQKLMLNTLLTVPPSRLRLLARWFEQSKYLDKAGGKEIRDDLIKMADLSEEVLDFVLKNKVCIKQD